MDQLIYWLDQKGYNHMANGNFSKAQEYFDRVLVCKDTAESRYNASIAYLKDNVYDVGFSLLNVLHQRFSSKELEIDKPVDGKTLLLYCDVAYDFLFLYARFIPRLLQLYKPKRVIVEVSYPLVSAVSSMSVFDTCVITSAATHHDFDVHLDMFMIPNYVNVRSIHDTIINDLTYIDVYDKCTAKMLAALMKNKTCSIYLNWFHDLRFEKPCETQLNDNYIKEFVENFPDVQFLSTRTNINNSIHVPPNSDAATLLNYMKLSKYTITTCSVIAHMAASAGCKVLLLLEKNHEWIWNNPYWYPNVVIFKQRFLHDWFHVFNNLTTYLNLNT